MVGQVLLASDVSKVEQRTLPGSQNFAIRLKFVYLRRAEELHLGHSLENVLRNCSK